MCHNLIKMSLTTDVKHAMKPGFVEGLSSHILIYVSPINSM